MRLSHFKTLTKDTLLYGIGNASERMIRFILLPIYSAYLPIASYGIRSLTIPLYEILKIFILLSIEEAVIADYYKAQTEEERRSVISTGFTFSLVTSLLIGGLTYIFAAPLAQLLGLNFAEAPRILRLFAIFTAFSPPGFVFLSFLRSERRSGLYAIYTIAKALFKVGFIIIFFVVLKRDLVGVYEVDVLYSAIFFIPMIIFIYLYSKGIKFSFKRLKSMFRYSLPLVPNRAFFWMRNMLDRWLIKPVLGEAAVGAYGFVVNFANIVSFVLVATVNLAWTPYAFSIRKNPDYPKTISRMLTYILLIGGWSLVVLGGSAREIVQLIAKNPEYWEGYPLAPLLVLGICFYGAYIIISTPCHTERRTGFFTITSVTGAVSIILINIFLLPKIGILASAIGSLVSYVVMLIMMIIFSRRLIRIPYEFKRILLIGLVSVIITFASFMFHPFYPGLRMSAVSVTAAYFYWHRLAPLLGLVVKLIAGTVLYSGLLVVMGFLKKDEKDILKRLIKKRRKKREVTNGKSRIGNNE